MVSGALLPVRMFFFLILRVRVVIGCRSLGGSVHQG